MMDVFPQSFGRYLLKEPLALGGMAELFLAETVGAHGFVKTVVIKRILPHLLADEQFRSMFINEAIITAQLAHPKIAQTYELGIEDDQLFIVMEYIDGVDGLALLRESAKRKTKIPEELAVYVMTEVLDALDFAHGLTDASGIPLGIVHRDVSPSNILLSRRGDVQLVDFGVATALSGENPPGAVLKGKYGYMSPEQVLSEEVTPTSDVFSAGVVLAEMLMGKRLFVGSTEVDVLLMVRDANLGRLEEMAHQIDPDLNRIVCKALCKKKSERFQSAIEFRNALLKWLFAQHKFVTNTQVAKLVASFYSAALAKRKKSLEDRRTCPAEASAAPEQAIADGTVEETLGEEDESQGEEDESQGEEDESQGEEDESQGEEYSIELGASAPSPDELELAEGTPPPSALVAESIADLDLLGGDLLAPRPDNQASDASSSISLMEPDPSSRDFDDSSIAGLHPRPSNVSLSEVSEPGPLAEPEAAVADKAASSSDTVSETSVLGTLIRLTMEKQSGKLIVTQGERRKEAFLKAGDPVAVSSNDPEDLFGNFLVRENSISSGELAMALAVMPRFNGQLGDTLVGLGLMEPLGVFAALTSQIRGRLVDLCTWTDGELEWFQDEPCPKPAFQLDLDAFEAYGAGAMATPRESIEAWMAQRKQMRPGIDLLNTFPPELFQVGLGARKYLDAVDGTKTVQDFVENCTADDAGLYELRLLFLLLNAGLLKDLGQ